jgi:hypothetical protein
LLEHATERLATTTIAASARTQTNINESLPYARPARARGCPCFPSARLLFGASVRTRPAVAGGPSSLLLRAYAHRSSGLMPFLTYCVRFISKQPLGD